MKKFLLGLCLFFFSINVMGCERSPNGRDGLGGANGDSNDTLAAIFHEVFVRQNNMTITMTLEGDDMDGYIFLMQYTAEARYYEIGYEDVIELSYYTVLEEGTRYTYMLLDGEHWYKMPVFDDEDDLGFLEIFSERLNVSWFEEVNQNMFVLKAPHFDDAFSEDAEHIESFSIQLLSNGRSRWVISGHDDDDNPMRLQIDLSHIGSTVIDLPDFDQDNGQGTQPNGDTSVGDVEIFYPTGTVVVEKHSPDLHYQTVELEITDVDYWSEGDYRELRVYFRAKLTHTTGTLPIDVFVDITLYNDNNELIRTRTLVAYDLDLNESDCCFVAFFGLDFNKSTSYHVVIETRQR